MKKVTLKQIKRLENLIYNRLKACDTVTGYMSKSECIAYYRDQYPEDYKALAAKVLN